MEVSHSTDIEDIALAFYDVMVKGENSIQIGENNIKITDSDDEYRLVRFDGLDYRLHPEGEVEQIYENVTKISSTTRIMSVYKGATRIGRLIGDKFEYDEPLTVSKEDLAEMVDLCSKFWIKSHKVIPCDINDQLVGMLGQLLVMDRLRYEEIEFVVRGGTHFPYDIELTEHPTPRIEVRTATRNSFSGTHTWKGTGELPNDSKSDDDKKKKLADSDKSDFLVRVAIRDVPLARVGKDVRFFIFTQEKGLLKKIGKSVNLEKDLDKLRREDQKKYRNHHDSADGTDYNSSLWNLMR